MGSTDGGGTVTDGAAPVRFGVVGLGFGRCHAKVLASLEGAELVAVADIDPEAQGIDLPAYAAKMGVRGYRDGVRMLQEESLDAVVVAVPPRAREKLVTVAAEHGVAVFLEKPFASDEDHARETSALWRDLPDVPVMVDFCLRHLPAVVRLRELLDGPLGRALVVNADLVLPRDDSPAWIWDTAVGNGVVNENTCHMLDTLCYLMGDPVEVAAAGGSYLGNPLEDGVGAVIRFASGATAVLTGGALGAQALSTPATLSVYSENGQARLTGEDHMFGELTWATADSEEAARESWTLPGRAGISTYALRHFVDALRSRTAPSPGRDAGVLAVRLAMAVRRSLETGASVPLA
ncbi:Gfo/Idh/MocA family oxidoreductase [Streptomyces sp. PTM05]|uniref:Gfo/Idh/MocA family oxidoreductase n=1 Tax=Streptantibioticus parmotrematis TaxID=2873249 RepID=A0ABS7QPW8_9ACTN|nr:Gfo/Idh/MocA family oxidoreductase [Streptantibioticus parmotrematis]MBY8885234.1 Gfo/Idh/MocA family oxidoreductase [Streptantibioticus parmotrematis]